jgi:lantibiotic modifying enzyme
MQLTPLNRKIKLVKNEIHDISHRLLNDLDHIIIKRYDTEPSGLLSGSGGSAIYLQHRYLQTGKEVYLHLALDIIEKEITDVNSSQIEDYLSIGSSSAASFWLINQFVRIGILDYDEKIQTRQWIELSLNSTTAEELEENRHDLFYGFIGKAILAQSYNQEYAKPFVDTIIQQLFLNIKHDQYGSYWYTPEHAFTNSSEINSINLGIPHGILGILLFLFKCNSIYKLEDKYKIAISSVVRWLLNKLINENNSLQYFYSKRPSGSGKLGWCYGDLALAYTLLRYNQFIEDKQITTKAYELLHKASQLDLRNTGVTYFPQYDVYDMCLCHGTSSVAYMYKKIFKLTNDEAMEQKAYEWLWLTLDSLEKCLPILDELSMKNYPRLNTTSGFLNGLSGVGLVIMSFLNPQNTDWDTILLLDHNTEK